MSENLSFLKEKMVPLEAVQKLIEGSYEQLTAQLDLVVAENRKLFVGESSDEVARLATFDSRAVVGTSSGKYFEVKFESKDGEIHLGEPLALEVPVISKKNADRYMREYTLSAVDAILAGSLDEACDHLSAVTTIQESRQEEPSRDFAHELEHISDDSRAWRRIYGEQADDIRRQVVDQLESISGNQLEAKYRPMYETDEIPEEKFEDYREMVNGDLSSVAERLEQVQHGIEAKYLPFSESLARAEHPNEEREVLGHFCEFAEDLIDELQGVRGLVAEAVQDEECVMCLGQVYDSIAEALVDYEIAGAFVERMVGDTDEAV